ncbi:hypothetical protein QAD02_022582 [Eretmocerus hayati]|uniref:Uncharacterized protein n=1 Tax=Eretmocerus hayati TaxID=131215 RepID=A0ACC2PUZ9_9HYME|nr:hypothetical protein QAD02_022582 [Eretmocerus hayati]
MTKEWTDSQEQDVMSFISHVDIDNMSVIPFENLSQELFTQGFYDNEQEHDQKVDQKPIQEAVYYMHNNPPPGPILGNDEFPGQYQFQLILNYQNPGKHWVYSEKLCKVFMHMEEVLPLQFQWHPPVDGLWLRATMVYKLDQHRSDPVSRCLNHMAPSNSSNTNIDPRHIKHVIRCLHATSSYEENTNGHLSVLTPLGKPEAGMCSVPMHFKFFCKNSCASGMNRRPTEVIFTLENEKCDVLGRRKLEVRVCSCPKRDKEKEEGETDPCIKVGKKRKMQVPTPPPGKKILDTRVFSLQLEIMGRDNYNSIIKYAHDVMAGSAARSGNIEVFKPYMDEALRNSLQ